MKKKTTLILSLSLLIAAFVALATFFLTNGSFDKRELSPVTSSAGDKSKSANEEPLAKNAASIETSDWKEYCNKEYGFCLKYPGEFIRQDNNHDDPKILSFFKENSQSSKETDTSFKYALSLEEPADIDETREYYGKRKDYLGETEGVNAAGVGFIRFDYFPDSLGNRSDYPSSIYYFRLRDNAYLKLSLFGFSYPSATTVSQMRKMADTLRLKN
ncbi:MAG TPA: hypothetical protein ENJ77_00895 [Candidatus Moranbacteria bacterium]|nr:hypothetical protein [Candidatus Moranbacteria bacterium]